jgi:hypothetical protein
MSVWQLRMHHEWRHSLQAVLATAAAVVLGHFMDAANTVWMVLGTLMVIQTSRGTPAHQGLQSLFVMAIGIIAGFVMSRYVVQLEFFMIMMMGAILLSSFRLMRRSPENYQMLLQWLLLPLVMIVATLWPANNEMMVANRLLMAAIGGAIGIFSSLLILPVRPYREFSLGLTPILSALIQYSGELEKFMLSDRAASKLLEVKLTKIEHVLCSPRNEYPEWVFELGFNHNLRSSFRCVLVQLDRITEAFFSLDYHVRQPMDPELLAELAPHLAVVLARNNELLKIIRGFFAGEVVSNDHMNFTSDITDVYQSMRNVLPASVELLDVSTDYVNLAALARDVIDIREMLLQIVTGLPIDDVTVTD